MRTTRVIVDVLCALALAICGQSVWECDLSNIHGSATCRPESGLVCDLACVRLGAWIAPVVA